MKFISPFVSLLLFFSHVNHGLRFEDFIPIKFDVIKVRSVLQMQKYKNQHTALDFVSILIFFIQFITIMIKINSK